MNPLRLVPAHLLNGISVALGIGATQLLVAAAAGGHAAQLALSGAVCASLADTPNTPARTGQRVVAAALLGFVSAAIVGALQRSPVALGIGIALIGFCALLTMAWGMRAGPVSFAPLLAVVLTMAVPSGAVPLTTLMLWNGLGAALYVGWALAVSRLLQPRYRALALAAALAALGRLLRSRADLLEARSLLDTRELQVADAAALRAWIGGETMLAECLQAARDFVFAAPDDARARRDVAILLHALELRDVLLASRLDLELLGRDAFGHWAIGQVTAALQTLGAQLGRAAAALSDAAPVAADPGGPADVAAGLDDPAIRVDDARVRLLPALAARLRGMAGDAARIEQLLAGAHESAPLTREQLQRFVAPEGWPLAAVRAELTWASPVLRHALRSALALGCAYFVGLLLPWATHPHWLVLSVAVVLRGNLEQTLARRNGRVLGTLLGCVLVLLLTWVQSAPVLATVFLLAVAVGHAFLLRRYWVTAAAASVMALLQAHAMNPAGGFAIGERLADTLLGALLALAFSYVLPSWERRHLPALVARVLGALADYAAHALAARSADPLEQRLARRRAYDALTGLAGALQRSSAEPKAVRVPLREVGALIDHGQRLMAHLSLVRLLVTNRADELAGPTATPLLDAARVSVHALLDPSGPAPALPADLQDQSLEQLPGTPSAEAALPWLQRRVRMLLRDAAQVRAAAAALGPAGA